MDKVYFAAKPSDELASDLMKKVDDWAIYLKTSGLDRRWRKNYSLYFGKHFNNPSFHDDGIKSGGEDGELSLLSVNHYRNLIKHILIMTTSQKPAFDSRAVNSDPDSLAQARLGNQILDAYLHDKRMARYGKHASEQSLVFGKGFIYARWEPSLGKPHAVEDIEIDGEPRQRMIYEGDVSISNPDAYSVICDQAEEDWTKLQHVMVREFKNKFDLAVRYPDKADKILAVPTKDESENKARYSGLQNVTDSALIPVYSFYHKRTDALPNGRYMMVLDSDCWIYDGPTPYETLPVFRIVPGEIWGTTEGYTEANDLVSMQEAFNTLASTAFSNQSTFGVQSVLVPNNAGLTADMIGNLRIIKYNPASGGKPEPLQLTSTPAEIFKFMEMIERMMETISGVNSVARGNPESSLKSGVALGLVQSMAVQYASGLQQSWAELMEDLGTFILKLLRDFAKTERMIALAGKNRASQMASFSGSSLSKIDRVVVELGNPMSRTTAGRMETANNLLEKGLVKTPQEYLTVMSTGNLDPLIKGSESQLHLIHKENEFLMDGKPVKALVTDSHILHIQEHLTNLSDPAVRDNEKLSGQTLAHVMEHVELYKTQDPLFAMINGEPPSPQPMAPPPGGPPPGPAPEQAPQPNQPGQPPMMQ